MAGIRTRGDIPDLVDEESIVNSRFSHENALGKAKSSDSRLTDLPAVRPDEAAHWAGTIIILDGLTGRLNAFSLFRCEH
jgi:hypothetical protein